MASPEALFDVPTRVRVRCEVGSGFTNQEYIVRLSDRSGRSHETWADRRQVEVENPDQLGTHSATGAVDVRAVEVDEDGALIELPNETMVGGRRVWIAMASIVR
jgi:hypothetical protein